MIAAHQREVQFCYEQQLQKNKTLAGTVVVTFTIGTTGEVRDASVSESTVQDAEVSRCLLDHVKKWELPRQREPVELELPWVFKPSRRKG